MSVCITVSPDCRKIGYQLHHLPYAALCQRRSDRWWYSLPRWSVVVRKGRGSHPVLWQAIKSIWFVIANCSICVNRKMTLGDSIERCLKKGKGDEQSAAAMCSVLLLMQLGAGEDGEEVMRSLYPVLKVIVLDNSASYAARAAVSYSGCGCNCLTRRCSCFICIFTE